MVLIHPYESDAPRLYAANVQRYHQVFDREDINGWTYSDDFNIEGYCSHTLYGCNFAAAGGQSAIVYIRAYSFDDVTPLVQTFLVVIAAGGAWVQLDFGLGGATLSGTVFRLHRIEAINSGQLPRPDLSIELFSRA